VRELQPVAAALAGEVFKSHLRRFRQQHAASADAHPAVVDVGRNPDNAEFRRDLVGHDFYPDQVEALAVRPERTA
jgi:hypothetical protein